MGLLRRVAMPETRQPWDERLPDGRPVYEAVDLPRKPLQPLDTPEVPMGNTPMMRRPIGEPMSDLPQRDFLPAKPGLVNMPAPPTMIQRNNKGRPVDVIGGGDPIAAKQELIRAQEGYKAPRSTKDQILSLLAGGVGGGIDYATNQNTRNRWAIGEDIAKEEGQIKREASVQDQLGQQRRQVLQEDLMKSQIGENQAQAARALREPLTREPGFTLGEGQIRYDSGGNVIATRPGKSAPEKLPERNVVNGVLVERQPDGSWKSVYESPSKPDTAGFTNEQITRNISDAANEQAKVEQALKDTAPTITKPSLYAGEPPTVERNPIYANLENRRNKLIDDQRRMRQQLKPSKVADVPSPQTHVLSKSNWLKSHSASDWSKAVAAAKDAGYQIAQ